MEDVLLNLHQNPNKIRKKAPVKIWKQKIMTEEVEKLTTRDELTEANNWPSPSRPLALGQSLQGQELHHLLHLKKGMDGSERKGETHWWQMPKAPSKPGGFTLWQGLGGHTAGPQGDSEILSSASLAGQVFLLPALAWACSQCHTSCRQSGSWAWNTGRCCSSHTTVWAWEILAC